jgi:hypothetical protein
MEISNFEISKFQTDPNTPHASKEQERRKTMKEVKPAMF